MMSIRHHDLAPRVEMVPLIDVIFLLLTFFIYSLITVVQAEILPVRLSTLSTGTAAEPGRIEAITIDRTGRLYLNRKHVTEFELDAALGRMAAAELQPVLFLAMEVEAAEAGPFVDRGPLLISLIERVRTAGLSDFNIVGEAEAP